MSLLTADEHILYLSHTHQCWEVRLECPGERDNLWAIAGGVPTQSHLIPRGKVLLVRVVDPQLYMLLIFGTALRIACSTLMDSTLSRACEGNSSRSSTEELLSLLEGKPIHFGIREPGTQPH